MKMNSFGLSFAIVALAAPCALSQTTVLNWDADGAAGVGGSGAWDTTSTLWNTAGSGPADTIWTTGNGASGVAANFGGTGGTVTVQAGGITTGVLAAGNQSALNFDAGGYTISGGKITIDNTGGGSDRSFLRFAGGTTTTINNDIDITPHSSGAGTFNRLVQARANNSTITLGGAINIIGTTAGTHTIDFITGGGSTGVRLNLDGAIGDAAGAAITRVRIASNSPNDLKDITVRLSAANTFTGGISGKGKLLVANNTALGTGGMTMGGDGGAGSGALLTDAAVTIANTIGSGHTGVTAMTIGGNSAHVSSFTGNVDLATNTAGLINAKVGLQAVAEGSVTFSGLFNDGASTIGMDKFGAGTVILSRATGNTIDGPVNVVNGTLAVSNTSGSATGTGAVTIGSAAGSLAGGATTTNSRLVTVASTAGMVIGQTITGTNIAGGTFVEQIKDGTTIVLSQNATGSATGLTFSLAASSGKLTGTGIIGGPVVIGAASTLSPTAQPSGSKLSLGSTLSFDAGGTSIFNWDLNAANTPDPGVVSNNGSYGQVAVTGAATNTAVFNISLLGGTGNTSSYSDAFWDTNKSWNNIFASSGMSDLTTLFTSFSGTGLTASGFGSTALATAAGRGSFGFNGTTLNWTAVPEPSSALAGLLITAGLLRRRRSA